MTPEKRTISRRSKPPSVKRSLTDTPEYFEPQSSNKKLTKTFGVCVPEKEPEKQ